MIPKNKKVLTFLLDTNFIYYLTDTDTNWHINPQIREIIKTSNYDISYYKKNFT